MSNNCVIRAESVTLTGGKYTITLPAYSLTNLCTCQQVNIGLYTSIPTGSTCNLVEVTDGSMTVPIVRVSDCCGDCVADLWRTELQCRSILCTRLGIGMQALTVVDVKGKMRSCCR